MSDFDLRALDPISDGEFVRRVYARSWPTTCRVDFSADEIIARLGDRDVSWWQRKLAMSSVRIGGGPAYGGFGFVLAAPEGDSWDMTYLFVEPEAFSTGLADELHEAAIAQLRQLTPTVGGWVLAGNERSQRFLARHGWAGHGPQAPPWPTSAPFLRYELALR